MATGTCGIDCSTCRLHLRGECSSCGPALSQLADLKIQTQTRLLGAPCPLLACARLNRINYCTADCDHFPCENYTRGPYPYSAGYLQMQQRRREEMTQRQLQEESIRIPPEHWQKLRQRSPELVRQACGVEMRDDQFLHLEVLGQQVRVSAAREVVEVAREDRWLPAAKTLALVVVVHLANAETAPLTGHWVTEHELECGAFFRGIHQLPLGRLLDHFGADSEVFGRTTVRLGGTIIEDEGDAAVRLWVLPKVVLKIILWCRDDELPAAMTIMFDENIEQLLPADGIWAMVHLVRDRMLEVAQ